LRKIKGSNNKEPVTDTINKTTCLDRYLGSFEGSLASRNYKPETLKNYRHLLRRFGKLLETGGIEPSALTPDIAVELGRRLPTTPKSQIKIPYLVRLFVAHLIEIGVATRPPLKRATVRSRVAARPPGKHHAIITGVSSQRILRCSAGPSQIVSRPARAKNFYLNSF
jgi:hypothetical protein